MSPRAPRTSGAQQATHAATPTATTGEALPLHGHQRVDHRPGVLGAADLEHDVLGADAEVEAKEPATVLLGRGQRREVAHVDPPVEHEAHPGRGGLPGDGLVRTARQSCTRWGTSVTASVQATGGGHRRQAAAVVVAGTGRRVARRGRRRRGGAGGPTPRRPGLAVTGRDLLLSTVRQAVLHGPAAVAVPQLGQLGDLVQRQPEGLRPGDEGQPQEGRLVVHPVAGGRALRRDQPDLLVVPQCAGARTRYGPSRRRSCRCPRRATVDLRPGSKVKGRHARDDAFAAHSVMLET